MREKWQVLKYKLHSHSLPKTMPFSDLSLSLSSTPQLEEQQKEHDDHWTNHQKMLFMRALGELSADTRNLFEKVASKVPGKGTEQVKKYFETFYRLEGNMYVLRPNVEAILSPTEPAKKITNIHDKTLIWTDNEHENFCSGVKQYGIGMWKQIVDNCVPTKTPEQISTHAEEFFSNVLECSRNNTINAAAIAIIKHILELYSSSKRKQVADDDHKNDDVSVLDKVPANFHPRKVQRTLNLFPLVSGDYASSSGKQAAEEVHEQEGENCSLKLYPTHTEFI